MKYVNLIAILFCVFVAGGFVQGQTKSSLIDEFQNPSCEDIWARLDGFLIQLNNNPDAKGTIAISGKSNDLRDDLYYDAMIRGYFLKRKVPASRWKIVRTPLERDRQVKFWLTAPGSMPPEIQVAEWSLEYSPEVKPFIFTWGENYMVEVTVCLYVDELALLARVLKANPEAKTNVVLKVRSRYEFTRRKRRSIAALVNDYSIRRSQIRIFKKSGFKGDRYGIEPNAEYWLIP